MKLAATGLFWPLPVAFIHDFHIQSPIYNCFWLSIAKFGKEDIESCGAHNWHDKPCCGALKQWVNSRPTVLFNTTRHSPRMSTGLFEDVWRGKQRNNNRWFLSRKKKNEQYPGFVGNQQPVSSVEFSLNPTIQSNRLSPTRPMTGTGTSLMPCLPTGPHHVLWESVASDRTVVGPVQDGAGVRSVQSL